MRVAPKGDLPGLSGLGFVARHFEEVSEDGEVAVALDDEVLEVADGEPNGLLLVVTTTRDHDTVRSI